MNPAFYELRRVLRSRFVIILFVILLVLPPLFSYLATNEISSIQNNNYSGVATGFFISGNKVHLVTYSYNNYGEPNRDANIKFSYEGLNYTIKPGPNGYGNITVPYNNSNSVQLQSITMQITIVDSLGITQEDKVLQIPPGTNYSGLIFSGTIVNPQNVSSLGVIGLYIGPNGTPSPPLHVEVYAVNESQIVTGNFTQAEEYLELNAYSPPTTVIRIFPSAPVKYLSQTQAVLVFNNSTGQPIVEYGTGAYVSFSSPNLTNYSPPTQVDSTFQSTAVNIIDFFIVIMGLFMGYFTYGKDKTSGIIESVLKRPITRIKLILSRYVASALIILVGVVLSMIISDLIYITQLHEHLSTLYLFSASISLAAVGIIFLGISYLISSLVRSQGALLGFTFLIYFVMGLFASTIIDIASLLSGNFYKYYFILSYVFPSQIPGLSYELIINKISFLLFTGSQTPSLASVGLTPVNLIIIGLLWVIIPIVLAIAITNRAD